MDDLIFVKLEFLQGGEDHLQEGHIVLEVWVISCDAPC